MPKISSIRLFHRFDSTTGMLGSHLSLLCSASSCVDPGTLGPAAFDWPPKGISVPSGKTIFTPCPVLELAFTAVFGIADASPPAPCWAFTGNWMGGSCPEVKGLVSPMAPKRSSLAAATDWEALGGIGTLWARKSFSSCCWRSRVSTRVFWWPASSRTALPTSACKVSMLIRTRLSCSSKTKGTEAFALPGAYPVVAGKETPLLVWERPLGDLSLAGCSMAAKSDSARCRFQDLLSRSVVCCQSWTLENPRRKPIQGGS